MISWTIALNITPMLICIVGKERIINIHSTFSPTVVVHPAICPISTQLQITKEMES